MTSISADGWARIRWEHGRNHIKYRAICPVCPWVGDLHESVNTAEGDMDRHTATPGHKASVTHRDQQIVEEVMKKWD